MTFNQQTIHSKTIYHGLPDLSYASKGMTAIVTGANGISGSHMIRALAESPERWSKIYALSRRPPSGSWPDTVEHIPLDFLKSPEEIAKVLEDRNMKPDYIFFFTYVLVTDDSGALQWGDERLINKNNRVLKNFLEALPLASALPKRIFTQFGQKWYGVHLGATDIPDEESDPRLDEPNLYYTQADILQDFCHQHSIGWNSGSPSFVVGASLDSSQSLLFPILVYASVQKYLGKSLDFPSDLQAWYAPQSLSNAVLNSYLYEWSVLAPNTADQFFNALDDCAFTWGKMWPRLANHFEMEYAGTDTTSRAEFEEIDMPGNTPPHGKGPRSIIRARFSFVEWATEPTNIAAWDELTTKHDLKESKWKDDIGSVFGRVDFALRRPFSSIMSSTKAKKFGWFGFVDSYESVLSVVDEFVAMKLVPSPTEIVPKP